MRVPSSHLSTLLLSLLLSLLVWFIAVRADNPFEERVLPDSLPVAIINLSPDLILTAPASGTAQTHLTLRAPRNTWEAFTADRVRLTADLSGLGPGQWDVPIQVQLDRVLSAAMHVVRLTPETVRVTLEERKTREIPVSLIVQGMPASGYEAGSPILNIRSVLVSGPTSAVDRVSEVQARLSLENARSSFSQMAALIAVDIAGVPVPAVDVEPDSAIIEVAIRQRLGTRDVAVKLVTSGQPPPGYRVTNLSVSPPIITVSSADPQQVLALPGFVETQPLDLSEASSNIIRRVALNLPEGVTTIGEPSVLVQVSIAAIEGSTRVQRRVEARNLGVGLNARFSPDTVDVLIAGPLPLLDRLRDGDVLIAIDLNGLGPGTYSLTPTVVFLADQLRAESVLPASIEVIIERGPAPTRTPTLTPTATPSRTPTRTLSPPTVTPTTPTGTPTP
ncbi:MAG: CdaR family protein [Anaerolineales bacterium]|nr:CdaR family protein [Anaerolineales bacterium]